MAFRYKFEQLLRLAQHEEDEVKGRLAKKEAQIAEMEMEIAKSKSQYDLALEEKTSDLLAGRMERLSMYFAYFSRLQKAVAFFQEERERLEQQRRKIFTEYAEKRRARKIYERLRERHQAAYKKSELKKDQKQMDEFAVRAGIKITEGLS
jgi:flagellar FliJ protein